MIEVAETIDHLQDLRKETIEVIEVAEMTDHLQDLRKSLLVKKVLLRKVDLKINFTL